MFKFIKAKSIIQQLRLYRDCVLPDFLCKKESVRFLSIAKNPPTSTFSFVQRQNNHNERSPGSVSYCSVLSSSLASQVHGALVMTHPRNPLSHLPPLPRVWALLPRWAPALRAVFSQSRSPGGFLPAPLLPPWLQKGLSALPCHGLSHTWRQLLV